MLFGRLHRLSATRCTQACPRETRPDLLVLRSAGRLEMVGAKRGVSFDFRFCKPRLMTSQPMSAGAGVDSALPRRFGLLQATALNMSTMIGVGPFITIPVLMAAMGGPQAMLGWILGLVIASSDGLVWSELGAMMPGSGGSYIYLRDGFGRETFGRAMAFLFIWQFLLSGPLEIASGYIGFAQYSAYLWPGLGANASKLIMAGVGTLIIVLLYRRINGDRAHHRVALDRHSANRRHGRPERPTSLRSKTGVRFPSGRLQLVTGLLHGAWLGGAGWNL